MWGDKSMFDIIIRGGKVVDGSGGQPFVADLAISQGQIAEIGRIRARARQTIDAEGALVTPGFVDVHTHYDGQFLWDDRLDPSFSHGVTTAIGGNCGVGFAPVKPQYRQSLIELMEGVEEIPGVVLDEGLDWRWESFPDYLDRLAMRAYTMDIAVHMTHAPLRVFVMGDRALAHEPADAADLAQMSRLVSEGMAAGAVGVSGARVLEHLSSTGGNVPGSFARDEELLTLARAMGATGRGVFQTIPLGAVGDLMYDYVGRQARLQEHRRMEEIARASGRPVTYALMEFRADLEDWSAMLAQSVCSAEQGLSIHPQIHARGIGALTTLDGYHIFMMRRSYLEVARLPRVERAQALRNPARRAAILSEASDPDAMARDPKLASFIEMLRKRIANTFPMSMPLDYEPGPDQRLQALASAAGMPMEAFLYHHYVAGEGTNVCASFALNFADGNLEPIRELLAHPLCISGLGDGGAHVRMACDSALPTFQLAFWARDRKRGRTLPLEHIVKKVTKQNADLYGLADRGVLALGKRADINVIDHERLGLLMPRMDHDLPAGGARLFQGSVGYIATVVNGTVTRRHDNETGARPGRLIRAGL
jgi:N-acyl-D-amino-acid deacylase